MGVLFSSLLLEESHMLSSSKESTDDVLYLPLVRLLLPCQEIYVKGSFLRHSDI